MATKRENAVMVWAERFIGYVEGSKKLSSVLIDLEGHDLMVLSIQSAGILRGEWETAAWKQSRILSGNETLLRFYAALFLNVRWRNRISDQAWAEGHTLIHNSRRWWAFVQGCYQRAGFDDGFTAGVDSWDIAELADKTFRLLDQIGCVEMLDVDRAMVQVIAARRARWLSQPASDSHEGDDRSQGKISADGEDFMKLPPDGRERRLRLMHAIAVALYGADYVAKRLDEAFGAAKGKRTEPKIEAPAPIRAQEAPALVEAVCSALEAGTLLGPEAGR